MTPAAMPPRTRSRTCATVIRRSRGQYHYHSASPCLPGARENALVGWALDGYPILGMRDAQARCSPTPTWTPATAESKQSKSMAAATTTPIG